MQIDHISLYVGEGWQRTVDFYVDTLGWQHVARPATISRPGAWLVAPDQTAPLLHIQGGNRPEPGAPSSPEHICLGVDDVAVLEARLRDRGIECVRSGSLARAQLWVREPNGRYVELQER